MENKMNDNDAKIPKWFSWLMPSISDVFFICTFCLVVFFTASIILSLDGDPAWHIKAGEWIISHHQVPHKDLFSYTMPEKQWYAWEWLVEVIYAFLHKYMGLRGLVIVTAFIIGLTAALILEFLCRKRVNIFTSMFTVSLGIMATSIHWIARPHIFSFLFIVIWFWIIDRFYNEGKKTIWILPLLQVLWSNMHAGFVAGFTIVFFYFLDGILLYVINGDKDALKKAKQLALVGVLCVATSAINPYGLYLYKHIFGFMDSEFIINNIGEYSSPNFHAGALFFNYLLAVVFLAANLTRKKLSYAHLGLLLFWGYMALFSGRHVPIYSILAVLVITPLVGSDRSDVCLPVGRKLCQKIRGLSGRLINMNSICNRHLYPLMVVLFFVFASLQSGTLAKRIGFNANFDSEKFPVNAVQYLKQHPVKGRGFHEYSWGGYLIYNYYPQRVVFIDGRVDMYGERFFRDYLGVARVKEKWDIILDKYHIDWVLISKKSPLANAIKFHPKWKLAYKDKVAVLYLRLK